MRIVDAIMDVLKGTDGLTHKEAYQAIIDNNLYRFGAKDPESVVNANLRRHCEGLVFSSASPVKYFKIIGQRNNRNV